MVFIIDRGSCLARTESRKKDLATPKKSSAATWTQGNNIDRSIFTADFSKVYRKFISLMYAISALLLAVREAVVESTQL